MNKNLCAKNMIQCLENSLNGLGTDVKYYKLALALAFLSLQENKIVIDDKDIANFGDCNKESITNVINSIINGNFQIDGDNFIIDNSLGRRVISINELYAYVDNHISPRVNRYRSPLLSFYNPSLGLVPITAEKALNNTIFYQVNVSGNNLAVYEVENEINKIMSENKYFDLDTDYRESYSLACSELENRLKEKYPGCQIVIYTTNYSDMNVKRQKEIYPSKKAFSSYDAFYSYLLSRRKKSLLNTIGNCYYDLDEKVSNDILIQIFGLAVFLLNNNLNREDNENVQINTIKIEGYSSDSFRRFASDRKNACIRSLDDFIKHSLSGMDDDLFNHRSQKRHIECNSYRSILQDNSVISPSIRRDRLSNLLFERRKCLHSLIDWQNKLFQALTEKELDIIKKAILIYLQRLSDIEETYLYFRADRGELIQIIKDGLSHTGGILVGGDTYLAFSKVDKKGVLQGFGGCSINDFIEFLSSGLKEKQNGLGIQYQKNN